MLEKIALTHPATSPMAYAVDGYLRAGFVFYAPRAGAARHNGRVGAWPFWAVRRCSGFRELGYQ